MYKQDKLLRALAVALARQPGAGFQQLAEIIGVSRGTLYRLASSRDDLVKLLDDNALTYARAALDEADIDAGEPLTALATLTGKFLADMDVYIFWLGEARQRNTNGNALVTFSEEWDFYQRRMKAFFLRGQILGVFRADFPADWLLQSYDFQLLAAASGVLAGTIAQAAAPELVTAIFMDGAGSSAIRNTGIAMLNRA